MYPKRFGKRTGAKKYETKEFKIKHIQMNGEIRKTVI